MEPQAPQNGLRRIPFQRNENAGSEGLSGIEDLERKGLGSPVTRAGVIDSEIVGHKELVIVESPTAPQPGHKKAAPRALPGAA